MPTYPAEDTVIGPIVDQLHRIIHGDVGVERIYDTDPDSQPEHGSAIIPAPLFEILSDTNGKLYLKLKFQIRHVSRRTVLAQNLKYLYTYVMPYLQALAAWPNNELGGEAIQVNIIKGGIGQLPVNGQVHLALYLNIEVLTEFNIDLF
jgi:hypothetical protein